MYDPAQGSQIPISKGVPPLVQAAFYVGVVIILLILGIVAGSSAYNHAWPYTNASKVPIGIAIPSPAP